MNFRLYICKYQNNFQITRGIISHAICFDFLLLFQFPKGFETDPLRSHVSHVRESSLQSTGGADSNLIGRLVKVSLPHNQKTVVPVKPGVTVYELLIHCCKKRKLDPRDHFIRIKTVTTPTNNVMNDPNLTSGHGNENNSLGLR